MNIFQGHFSWFCCPFEGLCVSTIISNCKVLSDKMILISQTILCMMVMFSLIFYFKHRNMVIFLTCFIHFELSEQLYKACESGNEKLTKELISKGAKVSWSNDKGKSPGRWFHLTKWIYHWAWEAARVGSVKCLRVLFENGADLSAPSNTGSTPGIISLSWFTIHWLLWACIASYYGNLDCLQFLADRGVDLSAQDNKGSTPGMTSFFMFFNQVMGCERG